MEYDLCEAIACVCVEVSTLCTELMDIESPPLPPPPSSQTMGVPTLMVPLSLKSSSRLSVARSDDCLLAGGSAETTDVSRDRRNVHNTAHEDVWGTVFASWLQSAGKLDDAWCLAVEDVGVKNKM